ncbi:hypothetical protein MM5_180 [Morganella phage vB_Mm5]
MTKVKNDVVDLDNPVDVLETILTVDDEGELLEIFSERDVAKTLELRTTLKNIIADAVRKEVTENLCLVLSSNREYQGYGDQRVTNIKTELMYGDQEFYSDTTSL